jgi:hypothetical protein
LCFARRLGGVALSPPLCLGMGFSFDAVHPDNVPWAVRATGIDTPQVTVGPIFADVRCEILK